LKISAWFLNEVSGAIKKPPGGEKKSPWRLPIGTFRKFLFIPYSRRLGVELLGLLSDGGKRQSKNNLMRRDSQGENFLHPGKKCLPERLKISFMSNKYKQLEIEPANNDWHRSCS
jgi:hypothetical protein